MIIIQAEKQQSMTPSFTPESPPNISLIDQIRSVGITGVMQIIALRTAISTELLNENKSNNFLFRITIPAAMSTQKEKFITNNVKLSFDFTILFRRERNSSFRKLMFNMFTTLS